MLDRNRPAATTITHDPPIHVRVVEWKRRPEPLPPSRRSVPKRSHPVRPGQTRRTHGSEAFEGPQQLADRRRDTGDQPQGPVRITHRASAEPSAPGSPFVAHERPAAAARRSGAGPIDLSSVLPADPGRRPRRTSDSGSTALMLADWTTGRSGSGSPEAKAEQERIVAMLTSQTT